MRLQGSPYETAIKVNSLDELCMMSEMYNMSEPLDVYLEKTQIRKNNLQN